MNDIKIMVTAVSPKNESILVIKHNREKVDAYQLYVTNLLLEVVAKKQE